MRDYHLTVVSDCVASNTEQANRIALDQMKTRLNARVVKARTVIRSCARSPE